VEGAAAYRLAAELEGTKEAGATDEGTKEAGATDEGTKEAGATEEGTKEAGATDESTKEAGATDEVAKKVGSKGKKRSLEKTDSKGTADEEEAVANVPGLMARNAYLEHEIKELKDMIKQLEAVIGAMTRVCSRTPELQTNLEVLQRKHNLLVNRQRIWQSFFDNGSASLLEGAMTSTFGNASGRLKISFQVEREACSTPRSPTRCPTRTPGYLQPTEASKNGRSPGGRMR